MDVRWAVALSLTGLVVALPAAAPADPPMITGERGAAAHLLDDRAPELAAVVAPPAPVPQQRRPAPPARRPVAVRSVSVAPRALPAVPTRVGPTWQERRGAAALRRISYPWEELGWRITFLPARRGVLGLASHSERLIRMYVRAEHSESLLAFSIAHEIGHALDFAAGNRESHARWLQLRGIDPGTPWYGCEGCADLETPAGDFAEVFAAWQVGPVDFRSRMAPLPTKEEMQVLAVEFADLSSRARR